MRPEAIRIYEQLEKGKLIKDIKGNRKTKANIHKVFLYRKLLDILTEDIMKNKYTFSVYDIENLIKTRKKVW